jgi:flavin-dependent dehydrogenase
MEEDAVLTSEGRFTAPVIVDCSGWRGALVNDGAPTSPGRGHFSFGLETKTDLSDEGLSFWLDGSLIPRGLGWIFPVGKGSLIGLGSYVGLSKLKPALERFLRDRGAVATTYHGTYFPHRLFRPTAGRLFAVGDAAGQCLPLTAEGIRPALYFGVECGRIVQQIFDGRLGLLEGLERYRGLVDRHRHAYRILRAAQWVAEHAPTGWFVALTGLAGRQPVLPRWWPRYGWFGRFDPDPAIVA